MQRLLRFPLFLSILLSGLLLSACGFHLRNSSQLPLQLHTLYLQSSEPYGPFTTLLRQVLVSTGIQLVNSPADAPVTLNITNVSFTHDYPTLGSSTLARVYTFNATITYELTDAKGRVLLGPRQVSSVNSLTLNPDQLLESNDQADLLKQEMQRDLVNQLFYQLTSTQVYQALNKLSLSPAPTP